MLASQPNSLAQAAPAVARWREMASLGKVRQRRTQSGRDAWFLDFHPALRGQQRFLWGDRGHSFESEEHAEAVLAMVRHDALRFPAAEAVEQYRRPLDRPNRIGQKLRAWIADVEDDYAPSTFARYRGYVVDGGPLAWWELRNVYEINWENLRVWLLWLAKDYQRPGAERVGIGAKSRLNVLTAFRGFFKWLRRHEQYRSLPTPEWPSVAVVKTKRRTMGSLATQADVIERVPAEHRGIFYTMAHLTLRNGEARALRWGDYDFRRRELFVGWAMKSGAASSERKETKTDANAWYPVSAALAAWLEWRFPPESRFDRDAPLFAHPTTGLPYRDATLAKIWRRACQEAGVPYVSPYAASKHTTYSELARAGWDLLSLQRMGRHSDPKTTLGYIEEFGPSRGETQRAREELEERQRREDRVVPLRRER